RFIGAFRVENTLRNNRLPIMSSVLWLVIASGAIAVLYGVITASRVMASDAGTPRMQEIAAAIQEGAQAYLRRQYTTIAIVGVVVLILLGVLIGPLSAVGFSIGAVLSGAAGFAGMLISVRANVRTAQAASESLDKGLSLAFRSGAATGMLVAAPERNAMERPLTPPAATWSTASWRWASAPR